MIASKLVKDIVQLWHLGVRSGHQFDKRTHGWLGILMSAAKQATKPYSVITAAAISYFAIFSLFPLILLSIGVASLSFGSLVDPHGIIERLEFITPALNQLLGKNIDEISRARGPVTLIALIGLSWSASTFFFILTGTLNQIWGIERNHPVWKRRGLAILFVLVIVGPILILASFANNITANLLTWLPEQTIQIVNGISFGTAILFDIALFLMVYLILPHADAGWREILPGAIGAGLLWEIAKKTFLFFISTYISVTNLVYGSLAAIIAILTWAYLSGLIFLFGAYLSVTYYKEKKKRQVAINHD
ncbi:MAG TPA: YihY/virulence factor BrkB family protein [Leptolinea sp.]